MEPAPGKAPIDLDDWPKIHERIGNSQHLPQAEPCPAFTSQLFLIFGVLSTCVCRVVVKTSGLLTWMCPKGMVILSALACIQLFDERTQQLQNEVTLPESEPIQTPSDGLCFWSCMYLAIQAAPKDVFAWHAQPRNANGFPAPERAKTEQDAVFLWAMNLKQVFQDLAPMPEGARYRLKNKISANHDDMDAWWRCSNNFPCMECIYIYILYLHVYMCNTRSWSNSKTCTGSTIQYLLYLILLPDKDQFFMSMLANTN